MYELFGVSLGLEADAEDRSRRRKAEREGVRCETDVSAEVGVDEHDYFKLLLLSTYYIVGGTQIAGVVRSEL